MRRGAPVVASAASAAALLLTAACSGSAKAPTPSVSDDGQASAHASCVSVRRSPAQGGLPHLTLQCMHGGSTPVAAIRGPAIVNLWASWCGPCRSELPALARSARQHSEVTFIGIDTEDERQPAARFLRTTGARYPQLLDPDGRLIRALGLPGLPATIALDERGRIVWKRQGGVDTAQLRAGILAAKGQSPARAG